LSRLSSSLKVLVLAAACRAGQFGPRLGLVGSPPGGVRGRHELPGGPAGLPAHAYGDPAIGEYAREPDRWKGSGKIHDTDRDAAHFLDLDDQGKMFGGPPSRSKLCRRPAIDYETALRAAGV
jgi:hypothetical protein